MRSFFTATLVLIASFNFLWLLLAELSAPDTVLPVFALYSLNSASAGGPPFEPWQLVTYAFLHDRTSLEPHPDFNVMGLPVSGHCGEPGAWNVALSRPVCSPAC